VEAYRASGSVTPLRVDAPLGAVPELLPAPAAPPPGTLLLAPLAAHDALLGVLGVSRAEGAPPFSEREAARLRVVADHAALALWKARLIEEARAASETRATVVATVSHELRTPLTALTGYGELLADGILGPLTTGQHDVVERMRSVTHQLTGMIEEILTFSSLEAGRELVCPRRVDAAEPVDAAVAVVEPLARQKGLEFVSHVAPDLPPLHTDPDKVRQILVNLVGNAVKFTERGSVRLEVRRDGDASPCRTRGWGSRPPTSGGSFRRSRSSRLDSRAGTAGRGSDCTSRGGSRNCSEGGSRWSRRWGSGRRSVSSFRSRSGLASDVPRVGVRFRLGRVHRLTGRVGRGPAPPLP
jgi:signal transduction histidine kinase